MHQALTSRVFGFFAEGYSFTSFKAEIIATSDAIIAAIIQTMMSETLIPSTYKPTPKLPNRPVSPFINAAFILLLYTILSGVPLTVT